MRGNYIFDVDGKSILKIDTIYEYSVYARTLDGEILYEIKVANIKPIPLSEDIFKILNLRRGLIREKEVHYSIGKFTVYLKGGKFFTGYQGYAYAIELKYAHQLQNIYYVLFEDK